MFDLETPVLCTASVCCLEVVKTKHLANLAKISESLGDFTLKSNALTRIFGLYHSWLTLWHCHKAAVRGQNSALSGPLQTENTTESMVQ